MTGKTSGSRARTLVVMVPVILGLTTALFLSVRSRAMLTELQMIHGRTDLSMGFLPDEAWYQERIIRAPRRVGLLVLGGGALVCVAGALTTRRRRSWGVACATSLCATLPFIAWYGWLYCEAFLD